MKIEREGYYPIEEEFHSAVRKSIMFYYYQILNGKQPTLEQLKQKFGSLFYKDKTPEYILLHSTFDSNMNALTTQGIKTLTSFYDRELNKKFVPIMVDQDVRIPIAGHYLVMTIDLVREMQYDKRNLIEVVTFINKQKNIDMFYANHSIPITAHSYAFRKLFGKVENRLIIQYMKNGKEFFTVRKDPELRRLEAIVRGITDTICNDRFYPVHNMQCRRCLYKDICNKYKF